MNDADREYTRALYDASLLWGDEALGNMISLLRDKGLWDSSWLVVTSDHGEAFWQHGLWGHNDHLYEEMLHVPLVVRAPGDTLPKGTRVTGLVSPMDLFPSLMQWLDLPQVPDLDGQPLDPVIRGSAAKNRSMVLQSNGNRPDVGRTGEATKLIVGRGEGQGELRVQRYDLSQDPGEESPLEGLPDEQVLARLVALMGSLEGYIAKEFERAEHKRVLRAHLELQLASELALDQAMQALGLKIPVGHAQRELRAAEGDLADVSALLEALGYGGDTEE
jgi:arylsulfatase A-like enzyme